MSRTKRPRQDFLRIRRDGTVACLVVALAICGIGCSKEDNRGGPRVEVVPVTGKVLVDGEPAEGVIVNFYRVGVSGVDFAVPSPQGVTDENGVMTLSTYMSGDGGAPGEYNLVFEMATRTNPITGEVTGDAFKGKYRDPRESEYTVTIPEEPGDEPHDIGTFELTTDPE